MSDISIPPEAVEAAARAIYAVYSGDAAPVDRPSVQAATAAIAAALGAWQGVQRRFHIEQAIILPLPQKKEEG